MRLTGLEGLHALFRSEQQHIRPSPGEKPDRHDARHRINLVFKRLGVRNREPVHIENPAAVISHKVPEHRAPAQGGKFPD